MHIAHAKSVTGISFYGILALDGGQRTSIYIVIRENNLSGQTACAGQEEQASVSQIMDQEIDSEPQMTQCSEDVTNDSLVPDNDQSDDHEQDLLREPEHAGL